LFKQPFEHRLGVEIRDVAVLAGGPDRLGALVTEA
jgi:hypothetical protein